MPYALHWRGRRLPGMTYATEAEAVTIRHLETQQMELAEYSSAQLERDLTIRRVDTIDVPPEKKGRHDG